MRDANYFQKLYYHRLGTAQSEDKLIYERPDNKEMLFGGNVTDDGHYLIITRLRKARRPRTASITKTSPSPIPR